MNEWTHFFIKYISHTLFSNGFLFLWCVRDGWRDIYSERGNLLPISFSRSQGVPTFAPPCKLVRDASDRLRVPCSTAIHCILSKSERVVLITWSPSSFTPVVPNSPARAVIFLFSNENVTACQSTRGHYERTANLCHMLYKINHAVVCKVSFPSLTTNSTQTFPEPSGNIPRAPTTIDITVNLIINSFLNFDLIYYRKSFGYLKREPARVLILISFLFLTFSFIFGFLHVIHGLSTKT